MPEHYICGALKEGLIVLVVLFKELGSIETVGAFLHALIAVEAVLYLLHL